MNLMWILLILFIIAIVVSAFIWWTVYDGMKKAGKKDYFLGRE